MNNWKDVAKMAGVLVAVLIVYGLWVGPMVDKYMSSKAGASDL